MTNPYLALLDEEGDPQAPPAPQDPQDPYAAIAAEEEGSSLAGVAAQAFFHLGSGAARFVGNVGGLLGADEFQRTALEMAENNVRAAGAPQGTVERVAAGAGEILPELAAYIAGGEVAAAAKLPAAISRVAPFLKNAKAARVASDIVAGLPITAAREAAASDEHSTAGALGEALDSDLLRAASETAAGRAIAGGAIDVVGGTILHQVGNEIGASVRGVKRFVRGRPSMEEAAEDILRQHAARTPTDPTPPAALPVSAAPANTPMRALPGPGQTTGAIPLPASMAAAQTEEVSRAAMIARADRAFQGEVDAELTRALQADPERAVLLSPAELDEWRVNAEKRVMARRHPGVVAVERTDAERLAAEAREAEGTNRVRETEATQLRDAAAQAEATRPVQGIPPALLPDVSDLTAAKLVDDLAADGGFTFDPFLADSHTGAGYAVAFGARTGRKLVAERPSPQDVARFLRENAEFFGENPRRRIGDWRDPETGLTEIEPSEVHASIVDALRQARADGEKAIFDLAHFETIFTDSPAARVILEYADRTGRELAPEEVEAVLSRYAREAPEVSGAESAGAAAGRGLDEPGGPDAAGAGGGDAAGAGGVGRPGPAGDRAPAPGSAAPAGGAAVPAGANAARAAVALGAGLATTAAADPEGDRDNTVLFALAAVGLGALLVGGARNRVARQALLAGRSTAGLGSRAVQKVLSMLAGTKAVPTSTLGEKAERAYRETINGLYGLNQFSRAVGNEAIAAEAARASGWEEAAHAQLRSYYEPVAKLAKGVEPQVAALTMAERALELARNGMPNKGIDLVAAAQAARELRQIPQVAQAADALRGYYRRLLDRRLQNRLISLDDYQRLVAKGEFYVPFVRDFMDEAQKSSASRGARGLAQRGKSVRKMTDEEAVSQIRNPLIQAAHDTFLTERAVARQRVTTLVAEAVDANPGIAHEYLTDVTGVSQRYRGKEDVRVLDVTVDGRQRSFAVKDDALYDAWASLAPRTQDYAMAALRAMKNVERAGITVNPVFAVRNSIRDFFSTLIQYPATRQTVLGAGLGAAAGSVADPAHPASGALTGAAFGATLGAVAPHAWRTLAATHDILMSGLAKRPVEQDVYLEWLREGGSGFGYFPRTQQEAERMVRDLQARGEFHLRDVLNPKSWADALLAMNRTIESAPRLAAYKFFRAQGKGVSGAVARSRDISVDFAVMGTGDVIRTMTGTTAFFNAKLQGWDKSFRVLFGDRAASGKFQFFGPRQRRAWAIGLSTITASSVALWAVNKDDPEYWKQPLWARNLFWLVPRGDGTFWKVPKPFEYGYLFASVPERFLDWLYQRHPETFTAPGEEGRHVVSPYSGKDAAVEIGKSVVGDLTDIMPTVLTPTVENITNHDFFRGQPVVPSRLQNLPPELQFDDRTSSIGRLLGASMGVSPVKVDNLLFGYTGTSGRIVGDLVSDIARRTGLDDRGPSVYPQAFGPASPVVAPFLQPMITRLDVLPAPALDVLREMQRVQRVKNGLGEAKDFEGYFADHQDDLARYYQLKPIADGIERISNTIPVIAQDGSTPADVRREQIHLLRHMQFQLAQLSAQFAADAKR